MSSALILRSRLASSLSKRYIRFLSSDVVSGAPKEPLAPSSASVASATSTASSSAGNGGESAGAGAVADQAPVESSSNSKGWRFLKYGLIGALTGGTTTAVYASYGSFFFFFLGLYGVVLVSSKFSFLFVTIVRKWLIKW